MNDALGTINAIGSWIPSKIRGVIYALIGLFWLVDEIWEVLPDSEVGDKVASTIKLLALLMAVVNTDLVPDPRPPVIADQELEEMRADAGESTIITILAVLAIILVVALLMGWVTLR